MLQWCSSEKKIGKTFKNRASMGQIQIQVHRLFPFM